MKIEAGKTYVATHRSKIYAEGDRFTIDSIFESKIDKDTIVAVTFENGERYSDSIERFEPDFLKEVKDELPKPAHYDTGIDTIAFMRANCPPEQVEGFLRGNVFKYLQRYDKKNGVDDLKKAAHYIEMLIEEVEGR